MEFVRNEMKVMNNNNVVEEVLVTRILDTGIVIFGSNILTGYKNSGHKVLATRFWYQGFWSQPSWFRSQDSGHRDSVYRNRDSGHRDGHRLQQQRSRSTVGVCHTVTCWEDRTEFFPQGLFALLSRGHRQA